jgi:WD40 repeat protein
MADGSTRVYELKTLKLVFRARHSQEWIQTLKFSPCGMFLCVGSHDNFLYMYEMPSMNLLYKFGKSSSYVMHLDWSLDSNRIRTNDGSYELLYYDANTG